MAKIIFTFSLDTETGQYTFNGNIPLYKAVNVLSNAMTKEIDDTNKPIPQDEKKDNGGPLMASTGKDMVTDLEFENEVDEKIRKDPNKLLEWTARQVYYMNKRCLPCLTQVSEQEEKIKQLKSDNRLNKWLIRGLWVVCVAALLTLWELFKQHIGLGGV